MPEKVSRAAATTTTTTMRLSNDLLKRMDKEVKRRGLRSRTQFFEQTMRRALGMPAAETPDDLDAPSVFS